MARGLAVECDVCADIEFTQEDRLGRFMALPAGWLTIQGSGFKTEGEDVHVCGGECVTELIRLGNLPDTEPERVTADKQLMGIAGTQTPPNTQYSIISNGN